VGAPPEPPAVGASPDLSALGLKAQDIGGMRSLAADEGHRREVAREGPG